MQERVVIVDDEPAVRGLLLGYLSSLPVDCLAAQDGVEALALATVEPRPSLVLVGIEIPRLSGIELLRRLKGLDETIQVVMVTDVHHLETVRHCVRAGAYDYIVRPFDPDDLLGTVERALERGRLIRQNQAFQLNLERMVMEQTGEMRQARDFALLTLARLAESRDPATGQHLERMAEYSRRLAEAVGDRRLGITQEFVEQLYKSSPLHDIGKVAIPDSILLKPGFLTAEEEAVMRTHPRIGGDTLRKVIEQHSGHGILRMGMEIAYHHHERWDGSGYPHGLAGTQISLAARIVALADAYDTITSQRPYKPALDHEEALRRITKDRGTHFDPMLVDVFCRCHQDFAAIRGRLADVVQAGAGGCAPDPHG